MRTHRDDKRKISLRTLDVGEVHSLWTIGVPSEQNKATWDATKVDYRSMLDNRSKWMGGASYAELEGMMTDGWKEGAERIRALTDEFRGMLPAPVDRRRRKVWADQGDEVCRERLYNGQADQCWRRTLRQDVSAPQVITLVLPWVHSASVQADDMFWGAAAMLACTDLLEDSGYQVEVIACNAVGAGEWLAVTNVTIKAAGEPLRMDALAAMTAHAASYRYYGIPSTGHVPAPIGFGWGCIQDIPRTWQKLTAAGLAPEAFYVGAHAYSQTAAVRYISAVVDKLAQRDNG